MGRFRTSLLLALLASGPVSAQIQSTYDYLLLPHAPQSDSARIYSYDANGNLVRSTIRSTGVSKTLDYTPSNMIFKAGGSEYRYDTSGNRIAKIQRDANGNITKIERYFGAIETDGTSRTKYYFFGSKRVAKKASAGALSFYHADHLNSTSAVTDASGNLQSRMEFYEFGAVKSQEGTESPKYAYTGQEWDKETNLYNYNARMYDSSIGKFASADTIIPDIANPQSLNRYAYVRNNPLILTDPTGHQEKPMPEPSIEREYEKLYEQPPKDGWAHVTLFNPDTLPTAVQKTMNQTRLDPTGLAVPVFSIRNIAEAVKGTYDTKGKISFLKLSFHASPGRMQVGEGEFLNFDTASKLAGLSQMFAPGACVVLSGCAPGRGLAGAEFTMELGQALLKENGGKIVAPTRMMRDFPEGLEALKAYWLATKQKVFGIEISRNEVTRLLSGPAILESNKDTHAELSRLGVEVSPLLDEPPVREFSISARQTQRH